MAHSKHGEKVQRFYNSTAWRQARNLCVVRCRGRCQQCGKPGKEVHHIIPLDEKNVDDPNISLNQNNLTLLCTSCHNRQRDIEEENDKDYISFTDKNGEFVIVKKDEM